MAIPCGHVGDSANFIHKLITDRMCGLYPLGSDYNEVNCYSHILKWVVLYSKGNLEGKVRDGCCFGLYLLLLLSLH